MDAMVTARMPVGKKEAGVEVLDALGTTASRVINELFDYLIEYGRTPFDAPAEQDCADRARRLREAVARVDSIPRLHVEDEYLNMSIREARMRRLASNGLVSSVLSGDGE